MDIFTILLIAAGLSMDAFAIAVTGGLAIKRSRIHNALKMAFFFGLFQAVMPVIGWLAGLGLESFISSIDHWAAFILLSIIGCRMIYGSMSTGKKAKSINFQSNYVLFILAIATSIDALAVGLSMAFIEVFIAAPAIIIGSLTFAISFTGFFIGSRLGHFFENRIEILGGLVLIVIGIKILLEHLV